MKYRTALVWLANRITDAIFAAAIVLAMLALIPRPEAVTQVDIDAAIVRHAAAPIDCNQPVIRRWETPDGTEVLAPEIVPLWQYVQEPDESNRAREDAFRAAFERDLHAGDTTFDLTHQEIDGKTW